jgi:hypothetical protein
MTDHHDKLRADLHWYRTQQRAEALIEADKALARKIDRAARKARGELPNDPPAPTGLALQIINASKKARGEKA